MDFYCIRLLPYYNKSGEDVSLCKNTKLQLCLSRRIIIFYIGLIEIIEVMNE